MLDEDVVEFASKLFGLAREGATEQLAAYVEAGVSPDLANHKGDSLVMGAAYHDTPPRWKRCWPTAPIPTAPTTAGRPRWRGRCFKDEPDVVRALLGP